MIDLNIIRGIVTFILLLMFIFLFIWVYSPKRKKRLEDKGKLPFMDGRERLDE